MDVARWAGLARQVLQARGVKGETEVSLLFVDEDAIAALNEQFLGKTGPTDVLSFPIEDEPGPPAARRTSAAAVREARPSRARSPCSVTWSSAPSWRRATPWSTRCRFEDEVALLVVHGLLHLLGMDHEDEAQAERMEAVEQQLLTRFHRASHGA